MSEDMEEPDYFLIDLQQFEKIKNCFSNPEELSCFLQDYFCLTKRTTEMSESLTSEVKDKNIKKAAFVFCENFVNFCLFLRKHHELICQINNVVDIKALKSLNGFFVDNDGNIRKVKQMND